MFETYLKQQIEEVRRLQIETKRLQSMNYDMLDYLRTNITWLLEHCNKYNIPLPDIEKAKLFFKISGQILENTSSTERSPNFEHPDKTPEDGTEPKDLLKS